MKRLKIPYLPVILVLVLILSLIGIIGNDVQEWDEARNGVNAYEMYHNKDYVNLYYDGVLDTWNVKPPLLTWLIVLSYHLFGFNEFALRFPSLVATILFFLYLYRLVRLYDNQKTAFLTCFILLCCKAIIGPHVGITGDFDALLLFFLTAVIYYLIHYLEHRVKQNIYLAAILFGFAFYTKGFACFVILPGIVLFLILTGQLITVIKRREFWLSCIIGLLFIGSWLVIISIWGKNAADNHYHNSGAIETMLVNDIYERLATTSFDYKKDFKPDRTFVITTIDAHFNLWNYIFWLGIATGLFILYKGRKNLSSFAHTKNHRLLLLSLSLITPMALLLTFATFKHFWYLSPVYGYVAYITARTIIYYANRWKPVVFVVLVLTMFTLTRQVLYLLQRPKELRSFMSKNNIYFRNQEHIYISGHISQNILLYTKWRAKNITRIDCKGELPMQDSLILLYHGSCMAGQQELVTKARYNEYFIAIYSPDNSKNTIQKWNKYSN